MEWAENSFNTQIIGSGKSIRSRLPFEFVLSQTDNVGQIACMMRYRNQSAGAEEVITYSYAGRVSYISFLSGAYQKTSLQPGLPGLFMGFAQSSDSVGEPYIWFQDGSMTPR